jgi:hypothetical protein
MTTTQYIRSQQGTSGTIVVTARAVDPEGNIIVETYNIAVTPSPRTGQTFGGSPPNVGGQGPGEGEDVNQIFQSGENQNESEQ